MVGAAAANAEGMPDGMLVLGDAATCVYAKVCCCGTDCAKVELLSTAVAGRLQHCDVSQKVNAWRRCFAGCVVLQCGMPRRHI